MGDRRDDGTVTAKPTAELDPELLQAHWFSYCRESPRDF